MIVLTTGLAIIAVLGGVVAAVFQSLALEEIRSRLRRRVTNNLEETLTLLSLDQQEEWADEWRAELAAVQKETLASFTLLRGFRQSAEEMASFPTAQAGRCLEPNSFKEVHLFKRLRFRLRNRKARDGLILIIFALTGPSLLCLWIVVGGLAAGASDIWSEHAIVSGVTILAGLGFILHKGFTMVSKYIKVLAREYEEDKKKEADLRNGRV